MVEAVRQFIRECGVQPANFHFEKFAGQRREDRMTMNPTFRRQGRRRHRRGPGHRPARRRAPARRRRRAWPRWTARSWSHELRSLPGAADQLLTLTADLETYAGAERVMAEAAAALRPHRHPRQQRRRHDLGQALRALRASTRSRPRCAARCSPRCGAATPCCPSCCSKAAGAIVNVSSIATRGVNRVPYARGQGRRQRADGLPRLRERAARHPRQRHRARAAPRRRRAASRATPSSPPSRRRPGTSRSSTRRSQSSLMKRYGTIDEQVGADPVPGLGRRRPTSPASTLPVGGGDLG